MKRCAPGAGAGKKRRIAACRASLGLCAIIGGLNVAALGQGGVLEQLRWTSAPSNAVAGVPFGASILAVDPSGAPATN
ncbi:MAG TPA: hypothetical protein VFD73_09725, partial [Gemmatimonadales bacterium]|nr:hypothetical protein [Gemmatimonadales bacterium]